MLLELKDVVVRYGKATALHGLSMDVDRGEIVTLIGSNGAGKTTTLRAISGLSVPHSGEIRFQDKPLNGMAPHEIVRMGVAHVPEGRRVFGPMTVEENLELGAFLRSDRAEMARDFARMYESFPRLRERRGQAAGSLSGGEQQMLAIARALMTSPKVLLLDEPSLGLSPILVREVGRIVSRINTQGVTVILIEQNARMALKLAHRAYILELGKIILQGNARELADNEGVKRAYLGTA
ncbi:MAG: ABC transporter ATP-binding protein [Desulfobacteraceae bacterium]|nr:MAG: ABC transporter ATP-binding protein [Desulfobacteraceae bacterium]